MTLSCYDYHDPNPQTSPLRASLDTEMYRNPRQTHGDVRRERIHGDLGDVSKKTDIM